MDIIFSSGEEEFSLQVAPEETLLAAIQREGIFLVADCGGQGTCGKCQVHLQRDGKPLMMRGDRKLLACQVTGADLARWSVQEKFDRVVPETPSNGQSGGSEKFGEQPDILQAGKKCHIHLPEDVHLRDEADEGWGIAFDVGTTTVAAMLWNLGDVRAVEPVATAAAANPQAAFGADVISRLQYAAEDRDRAAQLQQLVVECMNRLSGELLGQLEARGIATGGSRRIRRLSAVGNTAMMHLLWGADPSGLTRAPFAAEDLPLEISAEKLGLEAGEGALVRTLPSMGGHLGADAAAVLLALRLPLAEKAVLALDIGTNGELLLACGRSTWGCSTAAGPAFEGANISCGMRGEPGAIQSVDVAQDRGSLEVDIIGCGEPDDQKCDVFPEGRTLARGLCGSGLIDAAAALLRIGWMDETGRLLVSGKAEEQVQQVELTPGIFLTQKDIRELQSAKGAVAAGVKLLSEQAGIATAALDRVYLAGAFGSYIRRESALAIGLLPAVDCDKVEVCGNAAGVGASLILLSTAEWRRGCAWAAELSHLELADHAGFMDAFLEGMYFPHAE